jgi:hypothetical protein
MNDSREKLGEAVRDEGKCLNVCARHAKTVYFDGAECPCCKLEMELKLRAKFVSKDQATTEFLALTRDMERR